MKKGRIPNTFPATDGDYILSSAIDTQLGLFTGNIVAVFDHVLDADRLAQALDILFDAWPILGCRFVVQGNRLYWERISKTDRRHAFSIINTEQECETFCTKQVDSRTGPQVNLGLFPSPVKTTVILKLSHQVSDGSGFAHILRTLSSTYTRLQQDPSYHPTPHIHGSRSGSQIMRQLPWTALPVILKNFITLTWSLNHPRATQMLPLAPWDNTAWSYRVRHISASRTGRIINFAKNHQATLNDAILTALLRSLASCGNRAGNAVLRIQMTVDLRGWYARAPGEEALCNLSAFEYVNLGTDPGTDFGATLGRVAAITRARKRSYFGLSEALLVPLVTALPYRWLVRLVDYTARKKAAQKNVPCLLTNTGPIAPENVAFGQPPIAAWVLPHVLFPPGFCLCVSSYNNTISLSAGVSRGSYALVDSFLDQMVAELPA